MKSEESGSYIPNFPSFVFFLFFKSMVNQKFYYHLLGRKSAVFGTVL